MGIWENDTPVKEAEVVEGIGLTDDKPDKDYPNIPPVIIKDAFKVEPPKPEFKGLPVRSGGDRIWLLKGGHKCWIRNAEVYSKLGFKFGEEKEIDFETLQLIPEGEPVQ